ncbi:MAG: hypothetical protein ACREU8_02605 [Gammaproteobacteria bacterium]
MTSETLTSPAPSPGATTSDFRIKNLSVNGANAIFFGYDNDSLGSLSLTRGSRPPHRHGIGQCVSGAKTKPVARQRYTAFVQAGIGQPSPWQALKGQQS